MGELSGMARIELARVGLVVVMNVQSKFALSSGVATGYVAYFVIRCDQDRFGQV